MTALRRKARGLTPCGPDSRGNHAVSREATGSDPAKEVEQLGY